ncbi:MAG: HD domain-containing protein [Desulfobacteraceae bacterium]|nr:HD domain-containing protein [Desulfobacteraceae bacterium]
MKCPGQDTQYWTPGAIFEVDCPQCHKNVEFFKDDTSRKCGHCGHRFVNPKMDFGCAAYCQYAEQCLGTMPAELLAQKEDLLKDRVAIEMKRYFRTDFHRIGHATRVARYAERLGKNAKANLAVVLAAAYLHDVGIKVMEEKYPGRTDVDHGTEGVVPAEEILMKLGAGEKLIEAVCGIVANHHRPEAAASLEFKLVYDADLLVNIEDSLKTADIDRDRLSARIETDFLTEPGKDLAEEILLSQKSQLLI